MEDDCRLRRRHSVTSTPWSPAELALEHRRVQPGPAMDVCIVASQTSMVQPTFSRAQIHQLDCWSDGSALPAGSWLMCGARSSVVDVKMWGIAPPVGSVTGWFSELCEQCCVEGRTRSSARGDVNNFKTALETFLFLSDIWLYRVYITFLLLYAPCL